MAACSRRSFLDLACAGLGMLGDLGFSDLGLVLAGSRAELGMLRDLDWFDVDLVLARAGFGVAMHGDLGWVDLGLDRCR